MTLKLQKIDRALDLTLEPQFADYCCKMKQSLPVLRELLSGTNQRT